MKADYAEAHHELGLALATAGQTSEAIEIREPKRLVLPEKDYIVGGAKGRPKRVIKTLFLGEGENEEHNWELDRKFRRA